MNLDKKCWVCVPTAPESTPMCVPPSSGRMSRYVSKLVTLVQNESLLSDPSSDPGNYVSQKIQILTSFHMSCVNPRGRR